MYFSSLCAAEPIVTPEKLQQLERRIQELKAEMHNTRTEQGRLQHQLQDSEENIGEIAERLEKLHGELDDKRNNLKDLEYQQKVQTEQLAIQRQALAQQIRAAYMMGRRDYLKMWLNQEDPTAIGRLLSYYDYFNRTRVQQIGKINATLQDLETLKHNINHETEELNALTTDQSDKKQQYELTHQERQQILSQLASTLESQDKELKRLEEDKRQLKMLLGTLEDALKDVPAPQGEDFAKLRGKLSYPVRGKVVKQFNDPLIGRLKWQGILIASEVGSRVQAVAAGRVVFAEWFRHLGLLVIIDHGKGYMSLYAHNQSLYTKTGAYIKAREVIASVGYSGGREIPGLYFEIRVQGIPTNPIQWLNHAP